MNVRVCNKTSHNRGQEEVHSASCLALKISLEAEMTLVAAESRITLASFWRVRDKRGREISRNFGPSVQGNQSKWCGGWLTNLYSLGH